MTTPSVDVVHLTETFIKVPCFALAYGAFSKLYENDGYVANQKPVLLSKLLALCTTLYKSQRVAANLLKQTELETTKSLKTILSCSLCHRLYLQPVVLFCGHTFCRNCVEGSFKCHACTECTTTGEVNDSLLITRSISHFYPDTIPLYELLRKSASMVRQGKYKEALELNNELLANFSHDARSFQAAAEAHFLTSNFAGALEIIDRGLQLHPDWPKFYFIRAQCLSRLGRNREALEYYFKCFLVYPYSDCLKRGVSQVFEEEIDQSDVSSWKRAVEYCAISQGPISDALSEMPEELRATIAIQPWMRFPPAPPCLLNYPASFELHYLNSSSADVSLNSTVVDSVRSELICGLCLRLLLYPCGLPCGHTFCRECIEQSLDYRPECPMCKGSMSQYVAAPDRGYCATLWKLVKFLLPEESAERQRLHEEEYTALSKVGIDPTADLPSMVCCLAFPGISCPLHIFEPRYRNMIRRSINSGSRRFGMFLPGSGSHGLSQVGVILHIRNCEILPDGRMLIDARGCARISVLSARVLDGCVAVRFDFYTDNPVKAEDCEAFRTLCENVHTMAATWLSTLPCSTRASMIPFYGGLPDLNSPSPEPTDRGAPMWVWWLVAVLPLNDQCRLKLLSLRDAHERVRKLMCILSRLLSEPFESDGRSSQGLSC
ncbi:hypothetical protein CRM22_001173 [Opisthorchis felineus]|uniref:RING-type domain-containing protein n=1 Tax=Opisthorchis felineus TaxID=147828 RepID=A0A4S2MC15_OPIFE|nr:hypothetical protein CRM22_001173 [Opisthorchis felineus]